VYKCSGVARIWCQGGTKIEAPKARASRRRRREHRGAKDAEWGGYGEGCPLPSRLGVWGSVVSSPSWVRGGAPAALSHFLHILGHITLLVARKIRFSCPKYKKKLVFFVIFHFEKNGGDSHRQTESVLKRRRHQTPGGHVPQCPCLATPMYK